jgi:hypothetical protein
MPKLYRIELANDIAIGDLISEHGNLYNVTKIKPIAPRNLLITFAPVNRYGCYGGNTSTIQMNLKSDTPIIRVVRPKLQSDKSNKESNRLKQEVNRLENRIAELSTDQPWRD